jgi:hypothetical protein
MIELLLSLSLLSAVMLAVASWTQVSVRAGQRAAGPSRWRAVAESVLGLIHDDLASGDWPDDWRARRGEQARVEVIDGTLRIETRAVESEGLTGQAVHRYALEAPSGELRLVQRTARGTQTSRLLLDHVAQWRCAVDEEENLLTVGITSADGTAVTRSYLLP